MKCAVAIILAIIGMSLANPVPPSLGLASLAHVALAPSVSISSFVNHGVTIPRVILPSPIVKPIVLPVWGQLGWNKHWH